MGAFVERYRYAIGSILLVLILAGAAFLLWRENKWKPSLEKRLDALQSEIAQSKISGVQGGDSAQLSDVNPGDLIKQIETKNDPTPVKSGKVAGASTAPSKNSSKPVPDSKPIPATSAPSPAPAPSQTTPSSSSSKPALPASPININSASAYELTALPGIGTATAQKIIDYRSSNGGYKTIEEIKNVKGIGDATFNKIKNNITVN